MPDWLDSDSLITASRGPYRFSLLPAFWSYIEELGELQILLSSTFVLNELMDGGDELRDWARRQSSTTFFRTPSQAVQEANRLIVDRVNNDSRYAPHHIRRFLAKADSWLIAHATVEGGRIITFEKPEPNSKKPKIPDVGRQFGVSCINLWDFLSELGAGF